MADITLEVGAPQISFATHASLSAGTNQVMELGTPTEVELSLLNLGDDAARMSAKADLGVNRAPRYSVAACLEWQVAPPTTAEPVEFYVGFSGQSSAAVGNPGYLSGSDAAYSGSPATLAEGLAQLTFIGSQICSADIEFQISPIGIMVPTERYVILVVVNRGGAVLCDTDVIETNVVFTPMVDDVA